MKNVGRMIAEEWCLSWANEKKRIAAKTFTKKDEETVEKMMAEISKVLGYEVWTINPQGFGFRNGKPTGWIYSLDVYAQKKIDVNSLIEALARVLANYGANVLVDDRYIIRYFTYTLPPEGNYCLHNIYGESYKSGDIVKIFADDDFSSTKKEDLKPFLS
jgi:hypothetical protein